MKTKDLLYYRALAGDGGGSPTPGPTPGPTVEENDVMFYDYDGTPVASYSKDEFLALTEMPANPDRTAEGLVAQGWNWTLADAQSFVEEYRFLDIGQEYTTASGATEIDVVLTSTTLNPCVSLLINGTVTIEWGDGQSDVVTGSSTSTQVDTFHTYSAPGAYTIKIHKTEGAYLIRGYSSYSMLFWDGSNTSDRTYCSRVFAIRMADTGYNYDMAYAFAYMVNLRKIVLSNNVSRMSNYMFYHCETIPHVTYPAGALQNSGNGSSIFEGCYQMESVCLPKLTTLRELYSNVFKDCRLLKRVTLSEGFNKYNAPFNSTYALKMATVLKTITSVGAYSFQSCTNLREIYVFNHTPPTLGVYAFTMVPNLQIFVPAGTLAAYQAATNWSTYASQMVEMPA